MELRDVAKAVDAETGLAVSEEKSLREWWLVVNDALDENQRAIVAQQVSEHLLRVQDNGGPGRERHDEGGEHRGGPGGQGGRKGGAGQGGMGIGVGAGGASINMPGM